jgi:hypothetical protein
MLSLYNSLGLDGGSDANGNRLLVIGNNVRGKFPEYSKTPSFRPLRSDEQEIDQSRSDVNQDGIVDAGDLTILLSNFNLTVENANNERSDINEDGIVDAADLTLMLSNWGVEFDVPDDSGEEEEEEEESGEDDGGGGEPNDPPIVGVVETINGLVYPTSRVNVAVSPALPMWIKERNV